MIVWEAFNALMDWMNSHGSNDCASLTIIMLVGAIVYDKIVEPLILILISITKEAISNLKERRKQHKEAR